MVSSARASAEQTISEANSHAENTVTTALAQAKQQLDDATARATAIHDGAERRLNLLISRHTETVRRLTEIRDVVTGLVSGEVARGSLEDEVNRALGVQSANGGAAATQPEAAQSSPHRGRQAQSGHAEARRSPSQADGEGEPVRGGRQAAGATARAASASLAGVSDPADEDPLTGPLPEQRDGARYGRAEAGKHPTEAAMLAAEEIRRSAEVGRRQPATASGGSPTGSERVLDETAAGGTGRSVEG